MYLKISQIKVPWYVLRVKNMHLGHPQILGIHGTLKAAKGVSLKVHGIEKILLIKVVVIP